MDIFLVIAAVAVLALVAELLLPTGGVLAALGAVGLVGAGVYALVAEPDAAAADWAGPGLITLGVLSALTFWIVARKVWDAHRERPATGGAEEMVGRRGEARTAIDPEGRVWLEGTVWGARLADGSGPVSPGDRVTVEAVEGLTLIVRPAAPAQTSREGVS